MQTLGSVLGSRAFGQEGADGGLVVAYQSHRDTLESLSAALEQPNGIALLQGPSGSGKTTVARQYVGASRGDVPIALVDGVHLTPRQLLTSILAQFDVQTVSQDDEQLLQSLDNFVSREARAGRAPILIIDNADRVTLSAQRLLNWFAALESGGKFALRIVLTGRQRMAEFVSDQSLKAIARRNPATFALNPLSAYETMTYLRTRLLAAGGKRADRIFPKNICDRLHELSRGWPGALNEHAMAALDRIEELKVARPVPRIIVSRDGETIREHELTRRKYVIGRSDLADIVIEDPYISKLHAMLQVYSNAVVLIDLNSTNGTTVNSVVVPKTVLRSNDVIMLGRHRLKLEKAPPISAEMAKAVDVSDTMTMQTLEDFRRVRARRKVEAIKQQEAG